jgi:hypothetical protein
MARLTPDELQEARRRTGRLGGRPRKPTVEEAREAALEELVPAAIRSLKAHLGDGNPNAWRAALRMVENQLGKPDDQPELQTLDARAMTSEQRQAAIARMVEEHPGLAALIPRAAGARAEP